MRACVLHAPEDLRLDTIAIGDPGPGEVRVRIGAGGICGSDLIITSMAASARCGCASR